MDTLFVNGAVFDGTAYRPGLAVAVKAGRIAAIGPDLGQRNGAEVVDLEGGLLLPGFVDAHIHPVQGGVERAHCDLSPFHGLPSYQEKISQYGAQHPTAPWILGGGWHQPDFPGGAPNAADLDPVTGDRPAFLVNADHHSAWVNSKALQLAGIDADTLDPADGRIERNEDGTPTGTLHEGAMNLVGRLVPPTTHQEMVDALLDAQAYLHSLGITGWQDAILGAYANLGDSTPAYVELAQTGRLTARVNGALWWQRDRGPEQIPELIERREALQYKRFRVGTVKIMQDGVAENFTAAMLDPYFDGCGCRTANSGLSFVDPQALQEHVTQLDAAGFQVHVHAIGDRAAREALDAFAKAQASNGINDNRHHIAHLQVIHPDDIPRFQELNVAANMQALWAVYEPQMTELTIPFLGPERTGWQYPFKSLQTAGARLVAGSDWPVSSPDPLEAIHVAVNRRTDEADDPFLPEQALDLATALAAYTQGSAWVNHADDTGRIAVGALADLAILDRDPFTAPTDEINTARVRATYVEGDLVFGPNREDASCP
ncbi:amidohydrolase [Kribbella albertanoniae]|uniref:Amidohydrolase n=1 Tax=Kribbella albertanoniae TaxID=1266829 RepID=A0A4R4QGJ5_9ACTN|nr:amidohydrolase [Kribbella albertanoniae]TDC34816.1 amidohydrolase [Kribbella albertanoniae]